MMGAQDCTCLSIYAYLSCTHELRIRCGDAYLLLKAVIKPLEGRGVVAEMALSNDAGIVAIGSKKFGQCDPAFLREFRRNHACCIPMCVVLCVGLFILVSRISDAFEGLTRL